MAKRRTLLWVRWVDSPSVDAHLEPEPIDSVGWLVNDGQYYLTIVPHWGTWKVSDDITIPKVAILEQWEIDFD